MEQNRQFNMRVDDTFLVLVDKIRRSRSPVPSQAKIVREAVHKLYDCIMCGAESVNACVYVAERDDGMFKIGVTRNIERREKAFTATKIIYCTEPRPDARGLEKLALRNLAEAGYEVAGEWVDGVPMDDVLQALMRAQKQLTYRDNGDLVDAIQQALEQHSAKEKA